MSSIDTQCIFLTQTALKSSGLSNLQLITPHCNLIVHIFFNALSFLKAIMEHYSIYKMHLTILMSVFPSNHIHLP